MGTGRRTQRAGAALSLAVATGVSVGLAVPARATAPGHLQIPAEPGVVAEVDGRMSARSLDRYGIIFRHLTPGPHQVVLRRKGARPQRAIVQVEPGQVTIHRPRPWRRRPQAVAEKTGMVMIQTLPVQATVKAESLGWPRFDKNGQPFRTVAPVGDHHITVCNDYRCLDYRVNVAAGRLRSILVDLDRGSIEDLSRVHAAEWGRHRRACDATGEAAACRASCELDVAFLEAPLSMACRRLLPRPPDAVATPSVESPDYEATSAEGVPTPVTRPQR